MSLRFKLLLPTFLFAVLLIGVIGFIFINNFISFQNRTQQLTAQRELSVRKALLDLVQETRGFAGLIAENEAVLDSLLVEDQGQILEFVSPLTEQTALDLITIYDLQGSIFAQAHAPAIFGAPDELLPLVEQLLAADKTVSTVRAVDDKLVLLSATRLTSLNGPAGVVVVGYNLDDEFVKNLAERSGVDLAIAQGDRLITSSLAEYDRQILERYQQTQLPLTQESEIAAPPSLILLEDNSIDLAQFQRQLFITITVVALISVVFVAFSFFILNSTSIRINDLLTVVKQVGAGDLRAKVSGSILGDEIGALQTGINSMTARLEDTVNTLEAHGQRLEIVASLAENLTVILNLDELLIATVDQIKESFGYYHAHIYLLDDKQEKLVVAAGTGPAGQEMKAVGHSIPLNAPASLVARAARTAEIVSVTNVREAEDWLPNRLLPDTYSEMAVPIILESQVVGVLDVQEDEIAGLDEGDANLLRSLANQVAVAIRNARLFEEVETALAEARAAQERYLAEGWAKVSARTKSGYRHLYEPSGATGSEAQQQKLEAGRRQALRQTGAALVALDEDQREQKSLVAPIRLSDQQIGALQLQPGEQSWSDEDLDLIEAVLDQFSQTAENLRLFDETRQRAGREQTIREITDKMRAAPNIDSLLETAARELGARLGVRRARLKLGREQETVETSHHGHDV